MSTDTVDLPPTADMVKGIARIIGAANQAALDWAVWTHEIDEGCNFSNETFVQVALALYAPKQ